MKKLFNNSFIYVLTLLIIGVITHLEWFNPQSVLNNDDWSFWHTESVRNLDISYGSWLSFFDFGVPNIQIYFITFKSLWFILSNLGLTYDQAVKFTFLLPIALGGFLFPFFFIRRFVKDNFVAFVCALFYGTTTFFLLRQTAHIPIAFVYAIAPIVLLSFMNTIEKNKAIYWIGLSILFTITIGYEIRMFYILMFIMLIYFVIFFSKDYFSKSYLLNYLIFSILLLLLNLYWILPTLSGSIEAIESTAQRGLFGSLLFNTNRALVISEASWTGSYPDKTFTPQDIRPQLYIIVFFVFISSLLIRKNSEYFKIYKFFIAVSLLGILLTSQGTRPFSYIYEWLYYNFPGFSLFREASKFYILTSIGYLGLLSIALFTLKRDFIKGSRFFYFLTCILIISLSLYNSKPLISKEIRTMFVTKEVSNDYLIFKNLILEEDNYFRVFWTPIAPRYSYFSIKNPVISNKNVFSYWKDSLKLHDGLEVQDKLTEVFLKENSNQVFDESNIKYVAIPLRDIKNDDNFYVDYGEKENKNVREWYIQTIDKINWLEKKEFGFENLVVYENKDYKPRIYITEISENNAILNNKLNLDFVQKNSSHYLLKITNLKDSVNLNFSETFNSNWNLYYGDVSWVDILLNKNKYFKPIKSELNFNRFILDSGSALVSKETGSYNVNSDGSINIKLTLFYKPQIYFYLGCIISVTTLIVICFYFMVVILKNMKSIRR